MKTIAALLLACFATLAGAVTLPPCYPTIDLPDKVYPPRLPLGYRDGLGGSVGWFCLVEGQWKLFWYFGTYDVIGGTYHTRVNVELDALEKAPDKRAAADALVTKLVTSPLGCADAATNMGKLCLAAQAEFETRRPPNPLPAVWIVKPNVAAADKSRPVYLVVTDPAGVARLGASTGTRAAQLSPCDCATKVVTTASTFCAVNGRLDHVAACMPAPTPAP